MTYNPLTSSPLKPTYLSLEKTILVSQFWQLEILFSARKESLHIYNCIFVLTLSFELLRPWCLAS